MKMQRSLQKTVHRQLTQRINSSSMALVFTFIELEEKAKIQDMRYLITNKGILGERSEARSGKIDSSRIVYIRGVV